MDVHRGEPAQKGNSDIALEIPPNFRKVKSALLHLKQKSAEKADKISSHEI
jgi:hypothetical protein